MIFGRHADLKPKYCNRHFRAEIYYLNTVKYHKKQTDKYYIYKKIKLQYTKE